ncbi:hypothetical protein [Sorangium sp. So ce233]|uniref:hypothetical protein n=1 Tax=Sorangium sp. So ce233 TaxID=3133290 RepID=UPI003F5E84B9
MRDALVEAETAMFLAYQERADYAAAQSDPMRATGVYLAGHASDRGIYQQEGEGDEELRDRVFTVPDVVSPHAILGATNAILAPYTDKEAKLFESVTDRLFLGDGTTEWHSFLTDGTADLDPQYQDRRYELRDGAGPGGAWVFDDADGRYFVLRVPDISGITDALGYAYSGAQDPDDDAGLFMGDGSDVDGSSAGFLYQGSSDALSIYQAIANTVERIRGHGVRWLLIVDPKL